MACTACVCIRFEAGREISREEGEAAYPLACRALVGRSSTISVAFTTNQATPTLVTVVKMASVFAAVPPSPSSTFSDPNSLRHLVQSPLHFHLLHHPYLRQNPPKTPMLFSFFGPPHRFQKPPTPPPPKPTKKGRGKFLNNSWVHSPWELS